MKRSSYVHITLLCILAALGVCLSSARAQPRGSEQRYAVYLPMVRSAPASTVPPPPLPGKLPAALAGTWFSGQLLPRALYDPATGRWGSANGLGQMYEFTANGGYTYLAFFRIENPGCRSEVTVYRQGSARAGSAGLTLQPTAVKTRTVIDCGGQKETVTDGPYNARTIPWSIGYDQYGIKRLTMTEDGKATSYYKDGMAEELIGTWRQGNITSAGFYNTATGVFAAQPGEGWWISISGDGRYRWGEFAYGQDGQGCALTGWVYLEGRVSVSGSHITFSPSAGVARVENACAPDQPRQEPWNDDAKGFTWLFRDPQASPKLVLMPDGRFAEYEFVPE
jgi:hypothetical protein